METSEALEKIYFSTNENGTHYYTEKIPFEREYIEYVRKDVFIEKANKWFIRGEQGCAELIKRELIKRGGIIDIDNYEYSDNDCLYFIVDKMVLCKFSQSNGGKYMIEYWEEIKVVSNHLKIGE